MRRALSPIVLLLPLMFAGCVIVGTPCETSGGASVIVTPGVVIVSVGESVTPSASQSWCDGRRQEPAHPRWSLSQPGDSLYVQLDVTSGRITGRSVGRATIVAITDQPGVQPAVSVTVR